ncbi:MAG: DUF4097 family beta strand repeat-containing protein [Acidobacteriota bacterium]
MNLRRSIFHGSTALLFGACVLGSEPGAFDRTLPVAGPVTLDVRSDLGGITITTGSSASVVVHAVIKPVYGRFDLDIAEANIRALERNPPIEQMGNRIRIGYVKDPALLRGVTMRFEIETPGATEVHAYTESGGIRINGIDGPAETATSSGGTEISNVAADIKAAGHSGAIFIRNAGGHVSVRNQSGGIQLLSIRGGVDAETTSGRTEASDVSGKIRSATHSGGISIDNATGAVVARNSSGSIDAFQLSGSVHAETKSGAIRISQISPAPIRAVARSGAIKVDLASGGGYLLDAQSNSGKVSGPSANMFDRTADAHSLKAQIGSGGPLVDLDTHSSRIEID